MTTFTLFTDPHLGTRRAAHTTRESSKRLTDALYQQAKTIVENGQRPICLGDLFDRAFNDEATLVQGYNIASNCEFTLAGNHDETNREGNVPSLRALGQMGVTIVAAQGLSEPHFEVWTDGIYVVPHHASQDLFQKALALAANDAANLRSGKPAVLMLHCNYALADFMAKDDATLNLPESLVVRLLEHFDLILLGHDHNPRTYLDGRVVILGNTHPTSFSDISDKYSYTLEITDDAVALEQRLIWSKKTGFATLQFGDYEGLAGLHSAEFIEVIGTAGADQAAEVSDFLQEIWRAAPGAYAVRNSVQVAGVSLDDEDLEPPKLVNLHEKIAQDLAGSDLQELFSELAKECGA